MAEIWQASIPLVIALAGIFHYFLADTFTNLENKDSGIIWLCLFWFMIAYFLVADSVFAVYLLAQNTTSADLTPATTTAYIVTLVSMCFTLLYFAVVAFMQGSYTAIQRFGGYFK